MKYKAAVLTTSDRASSGIYEDESGKVLVELLKDMDFDIKSYDVTPDDYDLIRDKLRSYCDQKISLIITTGGTGFAKKDVTVDASLDVIERQTPGIAELIRYESGKITPFAYLSRAVAGICDDSLIINFPGSPKACKENFEIIKPILNHALKIISGDTNH